DNAYEAGELDQAFADLSNLAAIKSKFGAEYFKNVNAETRGLEMELTHKPLDNLDVRLALSQAIDRKTLNDVASNGGLATTTISTNWRPGAAGPRTTRTLRTGSSACLTPAAATTSIRAATRTSTR